MTIFPDFKNIDFDSFFPVYDKDANAHIDLESKLLLHLILIRYSAYLAS